MKRRDLLAWAAFASITRSAAAAPSSSSRVRKLAWVSNARDQAHMAPVKLLREHLSRQGFVEGANLEFRLFPAADGTWEGLARAAQQAIAWNAEVVHVATSAAAREVSKVVTQVPIVFSRVSDPVEAGLVADAVRPGRNITGVAVHQGVLTTKRFELVRELLPQARRVAFLLDRSLRIFSDATIAGMHASAGKLALSLVEIDPSELAGQLPEALERAMEARTDALVWAAIFNRTAQGGRVRAESELLLEFEQRARIPAIGGAKEQVERGLSISLGPSFAHEYELVASQVARIFGGSEPASMPVEWVHSIELGVNLGAARRMGLEVPKSILVRADRVVE